jgi:hypothetical protein
VLRVFFRRFTFVMFSRMFGMLAVILSGVVWFPVAVMVVIAVIFSRCGQMRFFFARLPENRGILPVVKIRVRFNDEMIGE